MGKVGNFLSCKFVFVNLNLYVKQSLFCFLLILFSCQTTNQEPTEQNTPSPIETGGSIEDVESNVIDELSENEQMDIPEDIPLIQAAKMDLAERLGINIEEIEMFNAQLVEWPDSSFGCPQPGMVYAQVLQDGLFIQLKVGDSLYNYHSGEGRNPFLCEQALQTSKPTPIDLDFSDFETPTSEVGSDK